MSPGDCDTDLIIAQRKIFELCGQNGGVCCNGTCTDAAHLHLTPHVCKQRFSIPAEIRWFNSFLTLITMSLGNYLYTK